LSRPRIRREAPAASTIAATRGRPGGHADAARPRLRPLRDLLQEPAHPHRRNVGISDREPRGEPLEHPVRTVQRRRARAARQADNRLPTEITEKQQVARIDRHAEAHKLPARRDQRRGTGVGLVRGGGGAEDQHHVAPRPGERRRDRPALVRDRDRLRHRKPQRAQPHFHRLGALGQQRGLRGGRLREHEARRAGPEGMEAQDTGAERRERAGQRRARHAVGDDLGRRHHLPRRHARPVGQGRERDRRIDRVQPLDRRPVDAQDARGLGEHVRPPGEGRRDAEPELCACRHHCRNQRLGGSILVEIARIEARDRDLRDPRRRQRRDVRSPEHPSLAQARLARRDRMGERRPCGLGERDRPEPHVRAACPGAAAAR
jgi:hypothetical protein